MVTVTIISKPKTHAIKPRKLLIVSSEILIGYNTFGNDTLGVFEFPLS